MSHKTIYFDNAATSWPKPESVYQAMDHYMREVGANPGRSGHSRSVEAARVIFETREELAELFGVDSSERVVFSSNATHSLNLALKGLLKAGDEVVTTNMEHNSVIRPLRFLEQKIGVKVKVVAVSELKQAITDATKLVVMLHASNVTGEVFPIKEIGAFCRQKGVLFLVDAAQTAGIVPINLEQDNIDLLAFTGHKGLLGPQGIGGLCLGKNVELEPLVQGGTGSSSDSEFQPEVLPDKLEAGTLNGPGCSGLLAGVKFIKQKGLEKIHQHELKLTQKLITGLKPIKSVKIYGETLPDRVGVVSFNIDGILPSEIGQRLDKDHGIMVRVGLHCSPLAHKAIGTFPQGTVRIGFSCFNVEEEVHLLITALSSLAPRP
ncbi:MAG: aminotransferase class V-fold PLP-dependent enzyme [bacterium]